MVLRRLFKASLEVYLFTLIRNYVSDVRPGNRMAYSVNRIAFTNDGEGVIDCKYIVKGYYDFPRNTDYYIYINK